MSKENKEIETTQEEQKKSKFSSKKILIGLAIIIVFVAAIAAYYTYNKIYPSTDNAYVDANIVNISTKVGGYVEKVYAKDNQFVHKGDKLVQIDPRDYQYSLSGANANLTASKGNYIIAGEKADFAKSNVIKAESNLHNAKIMAKRYVALYKHGAGSLQDAQKYNNQLVQADRDYQQAKSSLKQALINVEIAKASVNGAKAKANNQKLNLDYTTIVAPNDGYVSNMNLHKGQLVTPGQQLFGFVDNSKWWVNANFKETDISRIKQGQKVKVELDMYDHTYIGTVDSISFANGTTFSLLPAENATGNWVKVTQRFPIKIILKNDPKYPLRVGASATVKVNTL